MSTSSVIVSDTTLRYRHIVGRRDDVIREASLLLRDEGPDALTSVQVSLDGHHRTGDDMSRLLSLRLFVGWCGYVLDMNHRVGVTTPVLGGPPMPPTCCGRAGRER